MPGKFHPISLNHLLRLILDEFASEKTIFGIPAELFYTPKANNPNSSVLFNHQLHNPVGIAAGPHSQMAQNIVAAWLMGARYIELKTIQTLDRIDVSKPCIDMQDEGYNCEWSQELNIGQSFNEYLNAWVIIHILNHKFGWIKETGTIFNMSAGYNMQGIMENNVQWFLDKMISCEAELTEKINEIREIYPLAGETGIPSKISDSITLSTMHGCPADEIEDIAGYFLEKRNLHTLVKLNPTLLGPEMLRDILNNKLGFKTVIPDIAFDHDLKYPDAITIIKSLKKKALDKNLQFGLKLTNTLEAKNNKDIFESEVEMMYMSGRALHPISVNLAAKLQKEFEGDLLLSFSAGADAFNISDILACGFRTVTVCSDLLKPGGYMRLNQYYGKLEESFKLKQSDTIEDFIIKSSSEKNVKDAALSNLIDYAGKVLKSKHYKRAYIRTPDIKTRRQLDWFDCISAPCTDTCATNQDVPAYMYFTSINKTDKAYEVILRTNPFPSVTGMVCDHLCQDKCTRINYDDPLLIREVKRFISLQNDVKSEPGGKNGIRVAIVGSGPSGLSCAYYLASAGFSVDIFEEKSRGGGMVRYAIPGFRLTDEAIDKDILRITETGVNIHYNKRIDKEAFNSLKKEYSYLFIGAGAQLSTGLSIEGIDNKGVTNALDFLFKVKKEERHLIGKKVLIIGGGNTAMDAARTAWRLSGKNGKVTIVYRRTINEMPADQGEIKAVIEEGVEIIEMAVPEKIIQENGHLKALICSRTEFRGIDAGGRPSPVKITGSEFEILCDTIITATGQRPDIGFAGSDSVIIDKESYMTRSGNVFIGGDAKRGASTAINAIADGRKAAEIIIGQAGSDYNIAKSLTDKNLSKRELMRKRSKRLYAPELRELSADDRRNFKLVSEPLDAETMIAEAGRCLYCDELCNICTTVCPNFANYSYEIDAVNYKLQKAVQKEDGKVEIQDDGIFEIRQKYQILNIANFCNDCGNCSTFCPTAGAPFREKPRFFLTISSFNEAEEGFYLAKLPDKKNLIFKQKGNFKTLTELPDDYIYETDYIEAKFNKADFSLLDVRFKTPCVKEVHFKNAAEMSILMKAADNLVFRK
jgi:putative selenate reductase